MNDCGQNVMVQLALSHTVYMLDGLPTWTAHSEHQEVWAGPSWSSFALKVRSLLLPGLQDPYKSVLLHSDKDCRTRTSARQCEISRHCPAEYSTYVWHVSACSRCGQTLLHTPRLPPSAAAQGPPDARFARHLGRPIFRLIGQPPTIRWSSILTLLSPCQRLRHPRLQLTRKRLLSK
jgi:hypothetical protein